MMFLMGFVVVGAEEGWLCVEGVDADVEEGVGGLGGRHRFSSRARTWSTFVANRFKEVRIPPFGPNEYCFITSL